MEQVFKDCLLCGATGWHIHNQAIQYQRLIAVAQVCGTCAEGVTNAYHKAHSGRWFSLPNPPPLKPLKAKIPRKLSKAVFERDLYRCKKCGTHVDLCADHIYPECKGGETTLENLQTLCRTCNSSKGSRIVEVP